MALEIERKFRVSNDGWRERAASGIRHRQGYFPLEKHFALRIRVAGDQGFLTIKGPAEGRFTWKEFHSEIPKEDAEEILSNLCDRPPVEKTRYRVNEDGMIWEVDVFAGANEGLVVAEIEIEKESQSFPQPPWLGNEVTQDQRYLNINLYYHPFKEWQADC
jgi:adenylate cyclase